MCLIHRALFTTTIFTLALITLIGQANIRFENYTLEDGLPHSIVNATFQDNRGWIWVGTGDGLARFDGISFKTYKLSSPATESSLSAITCFSEDADSNLWIGTEGMGLVLYERSMDRFIYFNYHDSSSNCISCNTVISITSDSTGNIWLGTGNGINRFDPKTNNFQWIQKNSSFLPSHISPFCPSKIVLIV